MDRIATAVAAALLVACGSGGGATGHVCASASAKPPELGTDFAPGFAGTWRGSLTTVVAGGAPEVVPLASVVISRQGENLLALGGLCPGALPGLVQSATAFDTVCFDCPSVALQGCDGMIVHYTDGTATLSGETLGLELHAAATGCNLELQLTQTLSGATRVAAARAGAPDEGGADPSLSAALGRGPSAELAR
jgi:hypothetical protein